MKSQLPFGWVCFSNGLRRITGDLVIGAKSQLPFGWVCFSNLVIRRHRDRGGHRSQLPFGWVCFSNPHRAGP